MQANEYNPQSDQSIHEVVVRKINTATASWWDLTTEGIMQRESVYEAVRRFYGSLDRFHVELALFIFPEHVLEEQHLKLHRRLQDMIATVRILTDVQDYPQTQANKAAIQKMTNGLIWSMYADMHGGRNPHDDNKIHPSANPHTDPRRTIEFIENSFKETILCPWHINNPDYCEAMKAESTNQNWAD
ncbi:uncharacterized protein EAF01_003716 [Botrytis porri]|uniref:uncharacterized protein n=1 Tax=Botrytis porri TaxID=87229 RepID=UPI0018FFB405|nr:uncharacterized protein EAF01_003716 [Botrytis porri]KAF7909998.1 hypothetical protein EAF01_003716 [Botrytis porri]